MVTPEKLTEKIVREAMSLGDTPLTGNGFVRACEIVLGASNLGPFVPCSINELFEAEDRICRVVNARRTP